MRRDTNARLNSPSVLSTCFIRWLLAAELAQWVRLVERRLKRASDAPPIAPGTRNSVAIACRDCQRASISCHEGLPVYLLPTCVEPVHFLDDVLQTSLSQRSKAPHGPSGTI